MYECLLSYITVYMSICACMYIFVEKIAMVYACMNKYVSVYSCTYVYIYISQMQVCMCAFIYRYEHCLFIHSTCKCVCLYMRTLYIAGKVFKLQAVYIYYIDSDILSTTCLTSETSQLKRPKENYFKVVSHAFGRMACPI